MTCSAAKFIPIRVRLKRKSLKKERRKRAPAEAMIDFLQRRTRAQVGRTNLPKPWLNRPSGNCAKWETVWRQKPLDLV